MAFDGLSAAVGIAGDFASAWYQNRTAQRFMHEQQDFQKEQYGSRYQTQVRDLQAAGLNPMLAYGQGPGSSPSGSMPQSAKLDLGRAANETRIASANEANLKADTERKVQEARVLEQQIDLTRSSAELNRKMLEKVVAEIDNTRQQLDNLKAQWLKDTSDQKLKDAMQASQQWLQRLYEQQEILLKQDVTIKDPKAKAASTTGAFAAHGENIKSGLGALDKALYFVPRF